MVHNLRPDMLKMAGNRLFLRAFLFSEGLFHV